MDFHLQNLRTGEAHALNPHRTLIGSAEHANIRTSVSCPYLAALVVRYPDAWIVRGLSSDAGVTFNRQPLRVTEFATPQPGDMLAIGQDRFRFVSPRIAAEAPPSEPDLPTCNATVRYPDGMEECRAVDHDLLFGRLPECHVHYPDKKLSRLSALIASHGGQWYVHTLSQKPIARNGLLVMNFVPLDDGDELRIGPLVVGIEIHTASVDTPAPQRADTGDDSYDTSDSAGLTADMSETADPDTQPETDLAELHLAGQRLEIFLRAHKPAAPTQTGLSGWLGAQRDRLSRFWYDTPEATSARSLCAAGKPAQAFEILDRAIRTRPDSPELLRELYRLYESLNFLDLCFRPLRQIEKLAKVRSKTDTWVLETLAKLCERLGRQSQEMFERALHYWNKLENLTGISYARERSATMATRAMRDGGFSGH